MPEMNGYEVCERLKSTEELSHILSLSQCLERNQDKVKVFGPAEWTVSASLPPDMHACEQIHLKLHALRQELPQRTLGRIGGPENSSKFLRSHETDGTKNR